MTAVAAGPRRTVSTVRHADGTIAVVMVNDQYAALLGTYETEEVSLTVAKEAAEKGKWSKSRWERS